MKTLLLPALVASLAILPFQQSKAAKFGEFRVGYKFTLKVDQVVSTKASFGNITPIKAPIPSGVPKYAKGNKIAFEIVSKGAIKTGKFSIPFTSDAGTSNVYNRVVFGGTPKTDTAIIYKSNLNKATSGSLTFIRYSGTGFNLTTHSVTYTLKKP